MKRIKIYLFGKYRNGIPFSYILYKSYFEKNFFNTKKIEDASFLVTGCVKDFYDNSEEIENLLKINPSLKLVVLSEEPFWDTVWGDDFQNKKSSIEIKRNGKTIKLEYFNLNHITTNIFDFENIPYFITTDDNYIDRYKSMFERNMKLDASYYLNTWEKAYKKYSFFMTRRVGKNFDLDFNDNKIKGLSRFRSLLCESLNDKDVYKEGKGWIDDRQRQSLKDWHLDKINKLDQKSYIVSALENTHMNNYISEKIFDAYAVQGIPIYYADKEHRIFDLIDKNSFINISKKNIRNATKEIKNFKSDKYFVESYIQVQAKLFKLFANKDFLVNERKRVVNEIEKEFKSIIKY